MISLLRSVRLGLTLLVWMTSIFVAHAIEPIISLGRVETNSSAGARYELPVTYLNPGDQELNIATPEILYATLKSWGGNSNMVIDFHCTNPGKVTVPAKGFVHITFAGNLPVNHTGTFLLELPGFVPYSVLLQITPALQPQNVQLKQLSKETTDPLKTKGTERKDVLTNRNLDSVAFFRAHFYPYESIYFIASSESPNAKFQVSFKYRLVREGSAIAEKAPPIKDVFFAYTQTSLWDLNKPSAPFLDTSYKPEVFYYHPDLLRNTNNTFRLDLQSGFMHESNGRDGAFSRSLNIVYIRPTFSFGKPENLSFSIAPRMWIYADSLEDNPDLDRYRGYVDLRTVLGWKEKIRLSTLLRAGDHFDKGSIQVDLSYPLWKIVDGLTVYLYTQFFTGYGESLLFYKDRVSMFRAGFGIFP